MQFRDYKYVNGNDSCPVLVSYFDAQGYCLNYGFLLPAKNEWEYAAGAAKGFIYPWGNESPDEGGIYRANFNLNNIGRKIGCDGRSPVKSFEKHCSPFGVVNMSGNVWEWINGKVLKGGGYFSETNDLRIAKDGEGRDNRKEGFRCIKKEI